MHQPSPGSLSLFFPLAPFLPVYFRLVFASSCVIFSLVFSIGLCCRLLLSTCARGKKRAPDRACPLRCRVCLGRHICSTKNRFSELVPGREFCEEEENIEYPSNTRLQYKFGPVSELISLQYMISRRRKINYRLEFKSCPLTEYIPRPSKSA